MPISCAKGGGLYVIYITGDMYSRQERFALLKEYGEPEWTADDYLIVCGDFGVVPGCPGKRNL